MHQLLQPEKVREIKEKANAVLLKYEHIQDPYELLSKIAEDYGIQILQSDLYEMSGALRKEKGKWVIHVNATDSRQRKLFTIAHELGHFFVHRDICDFFVDGQLISRTEQQKYAVEELEANEFAGNLIMPEAKVREQIKETPLTEERVIQLAKHFNVSAIAMATRLRNLDYVVPGLESRQPDPYALRSILGGEVFSIDYAPNDEERSARAAKSRAEANKLQAEANDIKWKGKWWAFGLGISYLVTYGGVFVFGCFLGKFFF